MIIELSGGDLGGTKVDWTEGKSEMIFDGLIYKLAGEVAVYVGME